LHGKEKCSPKLTSPKTLIHLFSHISYHNFTFSMWTFIAYSKQCVLIMEQCFVPSPPNTKCSTTGLVFIILIYSIHNLPRIIECLYKFRHCRKFIGLPQKLNCLLRREM
jgi:hypothetical protein